MVIRMTFMVMVLLMCLSREEEDDGDDGVDHVVVGVFVVVVDDACWA